MASRYAIHPAIGVARVGNSQDEFYLEPESIGGLPIACDASGDAVREDGRPVFVRDFKDAAGRVRRQAARFRVFRYDEEDPSDPGTEVTLEDPGVEGIEWRVHLANKKACWYQFSELEGDRMLGEPTPDGGNTNSYQARGIPLRNEGVTGEAERQKLIIDPGPRHLDGPHQSAEFSRQTIPPDYPHGSFPPPPTQGYEIDTLGAMLTDAAGRLVVLGGHGLAGGDEPIDSFAGADTWHDDIADGPVACRLRLAGGETVDLDAWVLVGSPKYAPELVNVVTLDDVQYDVAVRFQDAVPALYRNGSFQEDYEASFERDVLPILRRPLDYPWVANVPAMIAFGAPTFDPRDASEANRDARRRYFAYFRRPPSGTADGDSGQSAQLWSAPDTSSGVPLMPLNSGSNSVSNTLLDKFLALTPTQYFLLHQWAEGRFTTGAAGPPLPGVHPLDQASVGNCVGGPMCPGIEVTWSTRNPPIYRAPYRLLHRHDEAWYRQHGLSTTEDETAGGGCEPGDLTKRMAIPWQADFFQCTIQFVNFTDPEVNKEDGIPKPPTYYAYWWPPQSPMFVLAGETTVQGQAASGVPAGYQVLYPRGINSFAQMITAWSYLGFVVNQNLDPETGREYPYFAEVERNHRRFAVASVAVGGVGNFVNAEDVTFTPVWYPGPDFAAEVPEHELPVPQAFAVAGPLGRVAGGAAGESRAVQSPRRGRTRFSRRHGDERPQGEGAEDGGDGSGRGE
ncbi:MAG TPA: CTQ-dependent lysine 6-oxidase LodA [Thermoanaerobaculia bacterium]|nr:CTQ-dependent lysine 6-oxidase LodA [Thermoanaerobaculia bacterium]